MITNEELDFRASILGIITDLLGRLKGSGIIPTRDPLEEVVLRNLEAKEERLQDVLEDNPRDIISAINANTRQIQNQQIRIAYAQRGGGWNRFSHYQRWSRQQEMKKRNIIDAQNQIERLQSQREGLFEQRDEIFQTAQTELFRQSEYGAETLGDIRERINIMGGEI